jgi:coproporphyrinogen III oxidase
MSLPPRVRFEYGYQPEPGSAEARLGDYLRPREWMSEPEIGNQESGIG